MHTFTSPKVIKPCTRVCAFLLVLVATQSTFAQTRVLLVGESESVGNVLQTCEVSLRRSPNIRLSIFDDSVTSVGEINRIRASLATTRPVTVDRPAADVIAVVEASTVDPTLSFVSFDAHTGERLYDTGVPAADSPDCAGEVVAAIRHAVEQKGKRSDRIAVCILGSRNIDLPKNRSNWVPAVAHGLDRRLLDTGSLDVLERERLGLLDDVHHGTADSIRGADVFVQLDLAKSDNDQILATATLTDHAGKMLGVVRQSGLLAEVPAKLTSAIVDLLRPLLRRPQSDAERRSSLAVELRRVRHEAHLCFDNHDWANAANDAEVAVALNPNDAGDRVGLAVTRTDFAMASFSNRIDDQFLMIARQGPAVGWSVALHRLRLAEAALLSAGQTPGVSTADLADPATLLHLFVVTALTNADRSFVRPDAHGLFTPDALSLDLQQLEQLAIVVWQYRYYSLQIELPAVLAATHDLPSFEAYSTLLDRVLGDSCHIFCRSAAEYNREAVERLAAWSTAAAAHANHDPYHYDYDHGAQLLTEASWQWQTVNHQWMTEFRPACFGKISPFQARRWVALINTFKSVGVPKNLYVGLDDWALKAASPPATATATATATAPAPAPVVVIPPAPGPVVSSPVPLQPLFSKEIGVVLARPQENGIAAINKPLRSGNDLFVITLHNNPTGDGYVLQLLKTPLDASGPVAALSQSKVIPAEVSESAIRDHADFFREPSFLGSSHAVLCTSLGKTFVLPFDGKTPSVAIDVTAELPGRVQNVTDLGDQLFFVVQGESTGSSLVRYDLKTRHTTILASSKREAVASPFDNQAPMSVEFMASDPDRRRIVFFPYHSQWDASLKGLWEFDQSTGKFRRLLPTNFNRIEGQGGYEILGSAVVDHTFILMTGETITYDLAKDAPVQKAPVSMRWFYTSYNWPKIFEVWWHKYGNPGGSGVGFGDNTIEKRIGDVQAFDDLWQGAYPQFATDVPPHQLLVANWAGLWLLTPQ